MAGAVAPSVLAKVAPPGEIIGLGRRESLYDTDVEPEATPITDMQWFADPQTFGNATNTFPIKKKGNGVFTNMQGSGTGAPLPAGYKFGGYRAALTLTSYDEDPTLAQNLAFWSDKRLIRNMGFARIKTDQSDYMTMRFSQLVNWEENERIAVASANAFACLVTPGTDYQGRPLDVGSQPLVYESLQSWRTEGHVPVARQATPNPEPVINVFAIFRYDGTLVRPTG